MEVLPRLKLAAVDVQVVVMHASAKVCAAQAAKEAECTTVGAKRTKRTRFRKDVSYHATFQFVLFAVDSCGYIGKAAVRLVNCLGGIAPTQEWAHSQA